MMKFEISTKKYTKAKHGDIVVLKDDTDIRMICCINNEYHLIDLNTGINTITYGCCTVDELLDGLRIEEIIPSNELILKRIR